MLTTVKNKFENQLPKKPYCTDNLNCGLKILPLFLAVRKKYIQLNPPSMKWVVTYDIDRLGAAFAAEDADLPVPTWTVINPQNLHAHLIYRLATPVCVSGNAHLKPQEYLAAISAAYAQRLGADPGYAGLIAKNPWHPYWDTFCVENLAYDLQTLADYVVLPPRYAAKPVENAKGRNCMLFDSLRHWAYKAIRNYWRPGGAEDWHAALAAEAEGLRGVCLDAAGYALDPREVKHIVKSVWRWTWRTITPDNLADLIQRTHTPDQQRARINKRWFEESKQEQGMILLKTGLTQKEITKILGVNLKTVKNWSAKAKKLVSDSHKKNQ
jgi:DNA-binding transcriptional regulator YiaG